MTSHDELVTGHEKRKHYREDEEIREGRSIFYTTAGQLSKSAVDLEPGKQVNFPPYSSPPAQRRNGAGVLSSLEVSRASVTSADVQMIESDQSTSVQGPIQGHHKVVRKQSSYSPIDAKQIKILVVGDRFTGKSSLIQQTTSTDFSCHYEATHLLNCSSKTVRHKDKLYSVIILDLTENTLLEEKYFKEFCKGAMAAFVVYDLSRMTKTLSSIPDWKKKINNTVCKKNGNPIPIYLLGNKCDTEESHKDGASFAKLHKFTGHFRTSAKTGEGIEEAVGAAVKEILKDTYPNPPEICETPVHHKIQ